MEPTASETNPTTPKAKPESAQNTQNPTPIQVVKAPPAPPPPKKSHKKLIIVAVVILAVIIVSFVAVILMSSNNKTKQPVITKTKTTPTPTAKLVQANVAEAKTALNELQNSLGTNASLTQSSSYWNLEQNGVNNLTGYEFSFGDKASYKKIPETVDNEGNTVRDPQSLLEIINDLSTKTDEFFESQGFTSNELNSQKSNNLLISTPDGTKQNGISIKKAYEKKGVYCYIDLNQATATYALFYCGVTDSAENELQDTVGREIQRDLNTAHDPNTIYKVSRVIGNFATGGIGSKNGPGGGGFWAKKTDGKWVAIYATQNGGLPCSIAEKYDVPSQWKANCEEETPTPTITPGR